MAKSRILETAHALCDTQNPQDEALTREIVTRLADKWTLWTLAVLSEADGPLRFSRVMDRVEGVSQKSLTKALRQLERDGLILRTVFAEVPPRVEYAIRPIGLELLEHIAPLWTWAQNNIGHFQASRAAFDGTAR